MQGGFTMGGTTNGKEKVRLSKIIDKMQLANLTPEIDVSGIWVHVPEINRPALQLTGFYQSFDNDRLQIIGNVEYRYLESLTKEERLSRYSQLLSSNIPCLIFCRELRPEQEVIDMANKLGIPILSSHDTTSSFSAEVIRWLKVQLAPCIVIHGVLVDVYGEGVLITGESGIGKSEAALELIKRGHRLVTDDAVEIRKVSDETLVGSAPGVTKYFIELRGMVLLMLRLFLVLNQLKRLKKSIWLLSLRIGIRIRNMTV
jgi:HPr kinase/phosphorylase